VLTILPLREAAGHELGQLVPEETPLPQAIEPARQPA
jgi:hypothetical protein